LQASRCDASRTAEQIRAELEAAMLDDLEAAAFTHFLFREDADPELVASIRLRRCIARELFSMKTGTSFEVPSRDGSI
jgi:hypothetical protein